MDDDSRKQNLEKDIPRQFIPTISDDSTILQPFWVRCDTVLSLYFDREFVVRKSNFVLRIGTILWIIFLFSKII